MAVCLAVLHAIQVGGRIPVDLEVYRRGGEAVLAANDAIYQQSFGLPFTYPPLAALLFVGLALVPAGVVTFAMSLVSYLALAAVVLAVRAHLTMFAAVPAALLLLGFAVLEPVAETVRFGQVNLVLAAMVAIDLLVLKGRFSGYLLGLAICIKVTPAIFVLVPLARRDWPVLRRSVGVAVVGSLAPLLLVPHSWQTFWFHALWDSQRVGGLEFLSNQSITGAVWRAVGPGGSPLLSYGFSGLVLIGIVAALWRSRARDPLTAVLVCAMAGLLVSPISWTHHWVWVAPLVMWLVATSFATRTSPAASSGAQRATRWSLLGVAVLWLGLTVSRAIWLAPSGQGQEYAAAAPFKILSDAYPLLGLASLVLLLVVSGRQARSPDDPALAARTTSATITHPAAQPQTSPRLGSSRSAATSDRN